MNRMRLKAVVSSLLLVILIVASATGLMLYYGRTGMILGFTRAFLLRQHGRFSIAFLLLAAVHFALNTGVYIAELKRLFKK